MRQRAIVLPSPLLELAEKISYVTQVGRDKYSSSCPECGGSVHPNGEFPDRFTIFLHSKTTGGPLGWCRACGYTWVPGKGKGHDWQPDPATQARWLAEREQAEHKRLSEVEHALWLLRHERIWLQYHEALNEEARALYKKRGIVDDFFLDYWKLGYCQEFTVNYTEGAEWKSYSSDTLSIPVFDTGGEVISLRHRLLHSQRPQDRYRPGFKGLPAAPFICDYERELKGPLLLVEGEFKAMVSYICIDDPDLHVAGLPGKSPGDDLLAKFANCEPVYLLLDPDAYEISIKERQNGQCQTAAQRISHALGMELVRWIRVPDKVDDMIVAGSLGKQNLRALVRGARKAW